MKRTIDIYYDPILSKTKKRKKYKTDEDDITNEIDILDCDNSLTAKTNNVYSEDNHIYFHSAFNKKSIEMLIGEISKINETFEKLTKNKIVDTIKPKPIYIHITSYGGSLMHCFKAIDAVNRSKIEVHTIVEGYAASCGSLLSVIGKRRYMGKYASILMHQLSSGAMGKYKEIEDEYGSCKMFMDHIINIYQEHTNMTREQIQQQLDHDSWWNYDTCLVNGLVDGEWMD